MNTIILIILCQIILESFPISSSGHMLLLEKFLAKFGFALPELSESFDYFLHGPTILILMIVFWKDWSKPAGQMARSLVRLGTGSFNKKLKGPLVMSLSNGHHEWRIFFKSKLFQIFLKLCGYLFITTIIAIIFHVIIKGHLSKQSWFEGDWTLFFGFCITAVLLLLLLIKDSQKNYYEKLNLKKVLIIGFVQGLALLPGISRFASVYTTSRLLNLSPRRAFQFTFLIQFPLIVAGFLLGVVKLVQVPNWKNFFPMQVNVTFIFATVVAFLGFVWMRNLAQNKKIGRFCFYMLIPISLLIFLMVR